MQTHIPHLSRKVPGRVSYKCVWRRPCSRLFPPQPFHHNPLWLAHLPFTQAWFLFIPNGRLGSFLPPSFVSVLPSTWCFPLLLLLAYLQLVQGSSHRSPQTSSWESSRPLVLGLIWVPWIRKLNHTINHRMVSLPLKFLRLEHIHTCPWVVISEVLKMALDTMKSQCPHLLGHNCLGLTLSLLILAGGEGALPGGPHRARLWLAAAMLPLIGVLHWRV